MNTYSQVQQLVDQLSPLEQVRLLEYLTPRIRSAVAAMQPSITAPDETMSDGWDALFRIGDKIASLPTLGSESMTQSVATMRR